MSQSGSSSVSIAARVALAMPPPISTASARVTSRSAMSLRSKCFLAPVRAPHGARLGCRFGG